MKNVKLAGGLGALVLAGVVASSLPVLAVADKNAATKTKSDSSIGFVDLSQVTEEVKNGTEWKALATQYTNAQTKAKNDLDLLAKQKYLTKQEQDELAALSAKTKQTDGEKARAAELVGRTTKIEQEHAQLAMIEKPTEQQNNRLKEINDLREKANNALQAEYEKKAKQLQEIEAQMLDSMQGKILKKVEEVAESKNLQVVLDRQAVLFGGQDLTADILKKLK
jgi:Skp family chaperone for outer membrane proteins